jgi:hypothetical protein
MTNIDTTFLQSNITESNTSIASSESNNSLESRANESFIAANITDSVEQPASFLQTLLNYPFETIASAILPLATFAITKTFFNTAQQQESLEQIKIKETIQKIENLLNQDRSSKDDPQDDHQDFKPTLPFSFGSGTAAALSTPREPLLNLDEDDTPAEEAATITIEEETITITIDDENITMTLTQLRELFVIDNPAVALILSIEDGEEMTLFSDGTYQINIAATPFMTENDELEPQSTGHQNKHVAFADDSSSTDSDDDESMQREDEATSQELAPSTAGAPSLVLVQLASNGSKNSTSCTNSISCRR